MKNVVTVAALALSLLLAGLFARVLPAAVERERTGRDNALHAVCDGALKPEPSMVLGPFPTEAPPFVLKDYAGREVSLASLRGRVVLLNFWATWCPTCVAEMGALEQLARKESGRPFSLVAISVDEDWDAVRNFFRNGTPLTVLLDSAKTTPATYGTEKFPETFLIDKEGKLRFFVVSDRDWASPDAKACIDAMIDQG